MNNLRGGELWCTKQAVLVSGCVYFLAKTKVTDLDFISGRIHHQDVLRLKKIRMELSLKNLQQLQQSIVKGKTHFNVQVHDVHAVNVTNSLQDLLDE